jgi:cytochrome c-type biogenesis protein CcmH
MTGHRPFGRKPSASAVFLVLALLVGAVTLVTVGLRGGAPLTPAAQARQIAAGLRCPVCEDLSAADSPAPLAGQMRAQIRQQLAAGRSPAQIRARFVASYGDSVLLSPPARGLGRVAHLLPALVLLVGLATAVVLLRRWRTAEPVPTVATPVDVRPAPRPSRRAPATRPRRSAAARTAIAMALVVPLGTATAVLLNNAVTPRQTAPVAKAAAAPGANQGAVDAPAVTDAQLAAVSTGVAEVRRHPRSVTAHLALARAYAAVQQRQLSTVEYLAAARLSPDDAEANTGLALAAFTAGQPREALTLLDRVLVVTPRYPEALYVRGLVRLMGLKQAAAAKTDLDAYLAAAPFGSHRTAVQTLLAMIPAADR